MIKRYKLILDIINKDDNVACTTSINDEFNKCQLLDSAFTLKESGLYIGTVEGYDISKKELSNFCLFNIEENIDLKDKSIYRFPNLDLPRQKVDLLKDKFNMKVIRNPDKADLHVVSVKTIKQLLETSWTSHHNFKEFYDFLVFLKNKNLLSEKGRQKAIDMLAELPRDARVSFTKNYHGYESTISIHKPLFLDTNNLIDKYFQDLRDKSPTLRDVIIKDPSDIKVFHELVNSNTNKVYDTDICDIIDADLAVLETHQLDDITKMIHSSNKEDRTLALEMLANCNINKSFDVASAIFYWEYDWLKDTNNWNSVNVRSFRIRMKDFEGSSSTATIYSYNNYIQQLIKCDKLTKFAVDYTRKKLYINILGSLVGKEADVFKVDLESLQVKKEINENMKIEC